MSARDAARLADTLAAQITEYVALVVAHYPGTRRYLDAYAEAALSDNPAARALTASMQIGPDLRRLNHDALTTVVQA